MSEPAKKKIDVHVDTASIYLDSPMNVILLNLEHIIRQGDKIMAALDDLKALVAGISTDLDEIDGDLQKVLDQLAAATAGGTTVLDAAGVADLTTLLTNLKTRTRATADKVPTP